MKKLIYLFVMALLMSGCATCQKLEFVTFVDSINSTVPMLGKKYIILSGLKDVNINDLQFKEFSTYVNRALESKGYEIAKNINDADIVITLIYRIGEPKEHQVSFVRPIYGQTGVSSATTHGAIGPSYGAGMFHNTQYSSTTTYTPSFGVVGAVPRTINIVTYTRYVSMRAYDVKLFREEKPENELWRTEIVSTGPSDDLRLVFPVMIAAATPYLGENTGKKVEVQLYEDSKEVLKIKGIEIEKKK
jgi:hypothetical protein